MKKNRTGLRTTNQATNGSQQDGHHLAWGKPDLMRKLMKYLGKPRTPSKDVRVSTAKEALNDCEHRTHLTSTLN